MQEPTRNENLSAAVDAVASYSQGLERAWKQAKNPSAAARARDAYLAQTNQTDPVSLTISLSTNAAETQSVVYICGVAGTGPTAGTSREGIVLTAGETTSLGLDTPKSCDKPLKGRDGVDDIHLDLGAPLENLASVVVGAYDAQANLSENIRLIGDALDAISRRDLGAIVDYVVTTRGPDSKPYVYACASNGVSSTAKGLLVLRAAQTISYSTTVKGNCETAEKEFERKYAANFEKSTDTPGEANPNQQPR